MPRRSRDQIRAAREREWDSLTLDGWAMNGICSSCGSSAHVRGKRKGNLKCKECFVG